MIKFDSAKFKELLERHNIYMETTEDEESVILCDSHSSIKQVLDELFCDASIESYLGLFRVYTHDDKREIYPNNDEILSYMLSEDTVYPLLSQYDYDYIRDLIARCSAAIDAKKQISAGQMYFIPPVELSDTESKIAQVLMQEYNQWIEVNPNFDITIGDDSIAGDDIDSLIESYNESILEDIARLDIVFSDEYISCSNCGVLCHIIAETMCDNVHDRLYFGDSEILCQKCAIDNADSILEEMEEKVRQGYHDFNDTCLPACIIPTLERAASESGLIRLGNISPYGGYSYNQVKEIIISCQKVNNIRVKYYHNHMVKYRYPYLASFDSDMLVYIRVNPLLEDNIIERSAHKLGSPAYLDSLCEKVGLYPIEDKNR